MTRDQLTQVLLERGYQKWDDDNFYTPLKVCPSAAGYYVGRDCEVVDEYKGSWGTYTEPGSRESGYYKTEKEAEKALRSMMVDNVKLRECPENEHMYQKFQENKGGN